MHWRCNCLLILYECNGSLIKTAQKAVFLFTKSYLCGIFVGSVSGMSLLEIIFFYYLKV